MTGPAPQFRAAIAAVRPDLATQPMQLHDRGWDSNAVEVAGWIFKFPKRPEAVDRLRLEARILALVHSRVPLAVPELILHEIPTLFSEHRMIPGSIIETRDYDALTEPQKQSMAVRLAGFYAALHAIPAAEAVAIGGGPKPGWPPAETSLPILRERLPADFHDYARRAFAAYDALPPEDEVFGYFDGHGWNMAFVLYHAVMYATGLVLLLGFGLAVGLLNWLGFVLATHLPMWAYENRPFRLISINAGSNLVSMLLMGALFGLWH